MVVRARTDNLSLKLPLNYAAVSRMHDVLTNTNLMRLPQLSCWTRCRFKVRPHKDCAGVRCAWPNCLPGEKVVKPQTDCCNECRPTGMLVHVYILLYSTIITTLAVSTFEKKLARAIHLVNIRLLFRVLLLVLFTRFSVFLFGLVSKFIFS